MTEPGDWRPRIADTSFLYALYDETDAHHAAARVAMARPAPIVVPGEVLTETFGLWAHRLGRAAARVCFDDLCGRANIEISHETDGPDALALRGAHPGLSWVDAVVLSHCRRLGAAVETFDEGLRAFVAGQR